jgi:hypothetical protein
MTSTPPSRPSRVEGPAENRKRLGAGRSGQVFEEVTPDGRSLACKVFLPDGASSLVNQVLTGAVNPYRWDRNAVDCAVLRRRILAPLVECWFGGELRLPETEGSRWVAEHRAFELRAERVKGRHTQLRHTLGGGDSNEVSDLVRRFMRPLQHYLAESGFDGLLWQAGKGNPVAAANYMRDLSGGGARWVWIDAESGVPALFPMAAWTLVTTYLPLCVKHRRWLFDDVDVERLQRYIERNAGELEATLGAGRLEALRSDASALENAQWQWRSLRRHERGIESHLVTGKLSAAEAEHYRARPMGWTAHLLWRAASSLPRRTGSWLRAGWARVSLRESLRALSSYAAFFTSRSRRRRWANHHVRRRLVGWRRRGMLSAEAVGAVRGSMTTDVASEYVADFGVHLAIKPAVKVLTWVALPLLALGGWADHWTLMGLLAFSGAIGRTAYTGARTAQAVLSGRPAPWVALTVGVLPVIGNAAFPMQLLAVTRGRSGLVARFLVHDLLSGLGRRLPIWGGADTLVEHACNGVAGWLCRDGAEVGVRPLRGAAAGSGPSEQPHGADGAAVGLESVPSLTPSKPAVEAPASTAQAPRT